MAEVNLFVLSEKKEAQLVAAVHRISEHLNECLIVKDASPFHSEAEENNGCGRMYVIGPRNIFQVELTEVNLTIDRRRNHREWSRSHNQCLLRIFKRAS